MRRKFQAALFALLLAATGSALAQAAAATTAAVGPAKIGVIDIQTAILATNEGQRDFGALQTKFQPKQTELQNMSKEVDDLKKQLDTQGDKLNEEARATMVKNLEVKQKSFQRTLEDAQNDFEGQKNEIMRNLGNKVYATLDKYAKENSFSLILDVSNQNTPVLWASQATNITKPIVDAYNVSSGVPAPAKPATATGPSATKPAAPKPAATTPH
jgi:outer membrane protein